MYIYIYIYVYYKSAFNVQRTFYFSLDATGIKASSFSHSISAQIRSDG